LRRARITVPNLSSRGTPPVFPLSTAETNSLDILTT
jgi:hypothetical protein